VRRILVIICTVILVLSINVVATTDVPELTETIEATRIDEIERTIQEINKIREELKLQPISSDEKLKEMALNHSKYMNHNKVVSTVEESDLEYYRGRFPWDRASYYEYDQDFVYEFVKKDVANYSAGFKQLINDPVSRNVVFNPMYNEIGMGVIGNYITYDLGGNTNRDNSYVTYPYDKEENIPLKWQGDSIDDLSEFLIAEDEELGFPITIAHYGTGIQLIYDLDVTIVEMENGQVIPYETIMPAEYYQLKNTLTIVPIEKYKSETTYAVSIKFNTVMKDATTGRYNKIFTFTTEKEGSEIVKKKYLTRGVFTEEIIKNSEYPLIEPLEYKFTDVDFNTPQSIYIYTASDVGLIKGVGNNLFRPELNITKEQAFKILVLDFELNNEEIIVTDEEALTGYLDEDLVSDWAYIYVQKAHELGIITSKLNLIKPGDYLTEDEFEVILALYNKTKESRKK
jgi:hypothetical protein